LVDVAIRPGGVTLKRLRPLDGETLMRRVTARALAVAALALATLSPCRAEDDKLATLPQLAADIAQTSVSGISSGAYMAGQFQVAHSKIVIGAAIIAGGPYGCAESAFADIMPGPGATILNLSKAVNGCMLNALALWGVPDVDQLVRKTGKLAEAGRIDPIADLEKDRIYLFSGTNDRTVVPAIVTAAFDYYKRMGVPASNITYVSDMPAGHAFVTEADGLACENTGNPYVVDCDYDQAGSVLKQIYGDLGPRSASPAGSFTEFDQRPFFEGEGNTGMEPRGVVYAAPSCVKGETCRVHIAYHGCGQNRSATGEAFIKESGYANWADANRLIILFPQASVSPVNPQGCWDWWGYTGANYLTRDAAQIRIVYKMLETLAKPRP
jgi:poly(3-hydroxybutyrate) depolymerase